MFFKDYFSRQARKPTGLFGHFFMSKLFDKGNSEVNQRMTELVNAKGSDKILEIGFGSGGVIQNMASTLTDGTVEGIDFSNAMMRVAQRKNKHHLATGMVKLTHGNFDEVPYSPASFDTICSANTIYFWPDQNATACKIFDTLKPGGTLVLAFRGKSKMKDMTLNMTVFRPVSADDVRGILQKSGFSSIEIHPVNGHDSAKYCVTAHKESI